MNIFKKKMNTMICHNFNFLYLCYVKEFKKFTPMCREADRLHDNGHVIDCDFSHSGEGRQNNLPPRPFNSNVLFYMCSLPFTFGAELVPAVYGSRSRHMKLTLSVIRLFPKVQFTAPHLFKAGSVLI